MSIADKITSIETHLEADYEGLENIGADLTGINKNILNIRTILDTIYNDLPKVTGEGTEVTLTPTKKGKLEIQEEGNSTQETTNGYQLLNSANFSADGITATMVGGQVTMSGKALASANVFGGKRNLSWANLVAGNTYTLSVSNSTTTNIITGIGFYDSNDTLVLDYQNVNNGNGTKTFTIPATATKLYFFIQVVNGQTYNDTLDVMIESGSTAHTWEKYTGGIPAPNPSFPFPIKSVTGDNNVVVNSKNLWGGFTPYSRVLPTITCTQNADGSITIVGTAGASVSSILTAEANSNGIYKTLSAGTYCVSGIGISDTIKLQVINCSTGTAIRDNITSSVSFTLAEETQLYIRAVISGENINTTIQIQLETGSTATDYVAYGNQTKPLNLGSIELNKIGNYQDYIYKNNGKWYKKEIIKKITINSNDISDVAKGCAVISNKYFLDIDFVASYYTLPPILSNIDEIETWSYINDHEDLSGKMFLLKLGETSNQFRVYLNASTIEEAKTNLDNANAYFMYALATPNDIQITDTSLIEQLEEINKMKSYEGTTIITSTFDENNSQMIISASGLKGE